MNKSDASRENGFKSNGPFTEEGKQISSQNSLKHGLYSEKVVLPEESHQEFDLFYYDYISYYMPVGPHREGSCQRSRGEPLAVAPLCRLRIGRTCGSQKACAQRARPDDAFALDAFVVNYTMGPKGVLRALHRQEARMRRACERADMDLRRIQAARLAPRWRKRRLRERKTRKCETNPRITPISMSKPAFADKKRSNNNRWPGNRSPISAPNSMSAFGSLNCL